MKPSLISADSSAPADPHCTTSKFSRIVKISSIVSARDHPDRIGAKPTRCSSQSPNAWRIGAAASRMAARQWGWGKRLTTWVKVLTAWTLMTSWNVSGSAFDTIWVNDSVPAGAWTGAAGGDAWQWVSSNPAPFSGSTAHQSVLASGVHYHYFSGATATLSVGAGDSLITYVYLDPANRPREVMLQWFDGASWAHAAYWGENLMPWGADGTASQRPMGALPPVGQWVRLEIPANLVGLEGRAISGMDFVLYDGRAAWDYTGKSSASGPPPSDTTPPTVTITSPANGANVSGSSVSISASASDNISVTGVQFKLAGANFGSEILSPPYNIAWNTTTASNGSHTLTAIARDAANNQGTSAPVTVTVNNSSGGAPIIWVEDSVPAGAWTGTYGGDDWTWVSSNPAPFSGARAHQSSLVSGAHYHYFSWATSTLAVDPGDTLFAYVFLDPSNPPQEVMLQWFDGSSWAHAAYWGANWIAWGADGTASKQPMGLMPATGRWVRLDVPASFVGLEGRTLYGMNFVLYGGRATWDYTGKQPSSSGQGSWLADADTVHYPDLQTLPPTDLRIQNDTSANQKLLRFSNWIANRGQGPMEVVPVNNANGTTDAYQCIYSHDANGNWYTVSTAHVGEFLFHPQHEHWHFESFSHYQLRNTAADGSVGGTLQSENAKVSFCIEDSALVDSTPSHVQSRRYVECTQTEPQGLSVGWADVYTWDLYGQSLDITNLPDGIYWLLSTTDPDNLLNEGGGAAETNNTAALKIRIQGMSVTVLQ